MLRPISIQIGDDHPWEGKLLDLRGVILVAVEEGRAKAVISAQLGKTVAVAILEEHERDAIDSLFSECEGNILLRDISWLPPPVKCDALMLCGSPLDLMKDDDKEKGGVC